MLPAQATLKLNVACVACVGNIEWPTLKSSQLFCSNGFQVAWNGSSRKAALMFYCCFLSFFQCKISEVPQLIAAKFCHMVGSTFSLIMPVQKIERLSQKNWGGQKRAKFGVILVHFQLWLQISLDWIEISKIGKLGNWQRFLQSLAKLFGELSSANYQDLEVQSYLTFLADHISAFRECCARNFYTRCRMTAC